MERRELLSKIEPQEWIRGGRACDDEDRRRPRKELTPAGDHEHDEGR
jgi:hypothetical protein